jgi:hypothetical protein
MGKQLASIPPPSVGARVTLLRPLLAAMMRLQRILDRMVGGVSVAKQESAFRALEPDAEHGPILDPSDAPLLFKLLDHLDQKMGGVRPSEVRVGLLPACGVLDLGRRGRSRPDRQILIIGLPCFQIWTVDELSAVVAHEMAHLKLLDARFTHEVVHLSARWRAERSGRRGWGKFLGGQIGVMAARVCRSMEYRADQWSALCFRAETLSRALEKLIVVEPIFRLVLTKYEENGHGDTVFDHFARSWAGVNEEKFADLRRKLIAKAEVDPLDPHPSLVDRLNRLAKSRGDAPPPTSAPAMKLLKNPDQLKRMLSNRLFGASPAKATVFFPADGE